MAVAPRRVVREIPRALMFQAEAAPEVEKIGVAAYARVSTEREEQEESFERQVAHYTALIQSKSEWNFCGIYADPGISGTRAEKRPDFLRMIEDCRQGKIQKVLVKSISRFARNTVDALNYIRELKDIGVSVYFENENIDTLTPGGEVLITILAAMAEQESRTMSTNIKWSYRKRFESGNVLINTGLVLGYKKVGKDEEGKDVYEIEESEAETIRRIYREYLAGYTVPRICRGLENDHILTAQKREKWYTRSVLNILQNEIYTGNAILGKTYKADVLSKKRLKNTGQAPMYYVENSHPAIIDAEMFEAVKQEIAFRAEGGVKIAGSTKYTSKYPFSGLLICGTCGSRLRRYIRKNGNGKKVPAWGCAVMIKDGKQACESGYMREDVLEKTYETAMHSIIGDMDEVIDVVKNSIDEDLQNETTEALERIDQAIAEIQEKALEAQKDKRSGRLQPAEYNNLISEYSRQVQELEKEQEELQAASNAQYTTSAWLDNFKAAVADGSIVNVENGLIMKQLVEQIIVYDKEIEIHFKCGVICRQEFVK